jgi:hypothetical protein
MASSTMRTAAGRRPGIRGGQHTPGLAWPAANRQGPDPFRYDRQHRTGNRRQTTASRHQPQLDQPVAGKTTGIPAGMSGISVMRDSR